MPNQIIELTSDNFSSEVNRNTGLFMIILGTDVLNANSIMFPIIQELADRYHQYLKVGSLDTPSNSEIAKRFNTMGLFTILFFKSGELLKKVRGLTPIDILEFYIKKYM